MLFLLLLDMYTYFVLYDYKLHYRRHYNVSKSTHVLSKLMNLHFEMTNNSLIKSKRL